VLADIRYALRQLRKSPGFTITAVLTLALGIGANTAVFSLVNAILLRQLPFENPSRVMVLKFGLCQIGACADFSAVDPSAAFHDREGKFHSFRSVAEYLSQSANLSGSGIAARRLPVAVVSSRFLNVLGIRPLLGRNFQDDEDRPGSDTEALISYRLWQNTFGGAADILGRSVTLNGQLFTVIGVLPRGMDYPNRSDIWIPSVFDIHRLMVEKGGFVTPAIVRLADGVTAAQAQAEITTLYQTANKNAKWDDRPLLIPVAGDLTAEIRPALLMLSGAVLFVLLIACANVAGLMLVRTASRRAELAVRAALGASRVALMRQLWAESILIALYGGVLGVLSAEALLRLLYAMRPASVAAFPQPELSTMVLLYTTALSLTAGLLFGIAPAWFAGRQDPGEALKTGQWKTNPGSRSLQRALVCGEIALAVMLLTGAGLLIRTMQKLSAVPLGFRADHLLTFSVTLHGAPYEVSEETGKKATNDSQEAANAAVAGFRNRVLDSLRALPGVISAAGINDAPLINNTAMILGVRSDDGKEAGVLPRRATEGYFATMGIPLLEGRDFANTDGTASPKVVIVTRDLADQLWPGQEAVGRKLHGPWSDSKETATVIGVSAPQRSFSVRADTFPAYYTPYCQGSSQEITFVLRSAEDPKSLITSVRALVAGIDAGQPVFHTETMHDLLDDSESLARLELFALSVFGGLAVLLAAIGIYGTVSFTVAQRTREIGLRMALGAERGDVARAVLIESMAMALAGCALGLPAALWIGRVLKAAVFGVSTNDPLTLLSVVAVFVAAAALATLLPARRAAAVDPMEALRAE
jgi:putative ABC transport system permease protein